MILDVKGVLEISEDEDADFLWKFLGLRCRDGFRDKFLEQVTAPETLEKIIDWVNQKELQDGDVFDSKEERYQPNMIFTVGKGCSELSMTLYPHVVDWLATPDEVLPILFEISVFKDLVIV